MKILHLESQRHRKLLLSAEMSLQKVSGFLCICGQQNGGSQLFGMIAAFISQNLVIYFYLLQGSTPHPIPVHAVLVKLTLISTLGKSN